MIPCTKPTRVVVRALAFVWLPGAGPVRAQQATGQQRVLVIMARFHDVDPTFSAARMRTKYFDKLDRYLKAVSYGKTWMAGKVTSWYSLPDPVARYRIS